MRKIRVLLLLSGFALEGPLGGAERFGIELAKNIDQTRFQPIVAGLWDYHSPSDHTWLGHLISHGIEGFIAADWDENAPLRSCIRALHGIRDYMNDPVDIIHSHSPFGNIAAILLQRSLGAKHLVRTVHNEREWAKRGLVGPLLANTIYPLFFDWELGVARQVVEVLDRRPMARILQKRALVMYNAVDFQRFSQIETDSTVLRRELHIPDDHWIVGSVGRLTGQKGYSYLLTAIPSVIQQLPNVHFLIVGTGPQKPDLETQIRNLGLDSHVTLTGPRSDIEPILGALDLFVSSSLWEGLPTVILESMAAGTPVVATRVSGTTELVQDGITGRLVSPKDVDGLAAAIVELLNNRALASEMCARAQAMIKDRFSITNIARQHEKLYNRLLHPTI